MNYLPDVYHVLLPGEPELSLEDIAAHLIEGLPGEWKIDIVPRDWPAIEGRREITVKGSRLVEFAAVTPLGTDRAEFALEYHPDGGTVGVQVIQIRSGPTNDLAYTDSFMKVTSRLETPPGAILNSRMKA